MHSASILLKHDCRRLCLSIYSSNNGVKSDDVAWAWGKDGCPWGNTEPWILSPACQKLSVENLI